MRTFNAYYSPSCTIRSFSIKNVLRAWSLFWVNTSDKFTAELLWCNVTKKAVVIVVFNVHEKTTGEMNALAFMKKHYNHCFYQLIINSN